MKYNILFLMLKAFEKLSLYIVNVQYKKFFCVKDFFVDRFSYISFSKNIKINSGFRAGKQLWLEIVDDNARINIGDNVRCSVGVHIASSNKVTIKNNVLIGSKVLITDHCHGDLYFKDLNIAPYLRAIKSKGEVIISDNVIIGDNVVILAGVTIGENVVIGAGSIVTKSIPKNVIVVGAPARVIKNVIM